MHGWILIDKPVGVSSFYVVNNIRKLTKIKKVGHGGTLDPMASGLLPIALGEATKTADYITQRSKTYDFVMQFGIATDTLDSLGKVTKELDRFPSYHDLEAVLAQFKGDIMQVPPIFSATKLNGVRAYHLARNNQPVTLQPKKRFIHNLEVLDYNFSKKQATLQAKVSKGTYIRKLSEDIATALGCLAHLCYLRRVAIDGIGNQKKALLNLSDLYNSTEVINESLLSINSALGDIPGVDLNRADALAVLQGKIADIESFLISQVGADIWNADVFKATYKNQVISLLTRKGGFVKILRNFNYQL